MTGVDIKHVLVKRNSIMSIATSREDNLFHEIPRDLEKDFLSLMVS